MPKKGGFILASNHVSYLDPVALAVASSRKLNFMARHDLFKNKYFAWLISSVGAFPVKRDSPDISALKEAIRRVRKGKVLLMFPEGARQEAGSMGDAKSGIGFLVGKFNLPVIPAFVKGTVEALPKGAKCIRRSSVSVRFGKQIEMDGKMSYQEIAEHIMENIRHLAA